MTDERAFLTAILEQPDDDLRKLAYADWLEEQGDPRAEYLRLMMQVRKDRVVTPEQRKRHQELTAELDELREAWLDGRGATQENQDRLRRTEDLQVRLADLSKQIRQPVPARLQELSANLDTNWLAVVSDPAVDGCARNPARGWFRFDYLCDKTWADLQSTKDQTVRHCETCCKNVHFCDTIADAREHSQEGRCIAIDLGIIRREGDLESGSEVAMGLGPGPSREYLRAGYERDLDSVSQARLNARK